MTTTALSPWPAWMARCVRKAGPGAVAAPNTKVLLGCHCSECSQAAGPAQEECAEQVAPPSPSRW